MTLLHIRWFLSRKSFLPSEGYTHLQELLQNSILLLQIEMYGPLVHTWTMQHEAKLSFIKRDSHSSNFKNVCLTVPKTHQLWLCYQLECESHLVYPQAQTRPLIMHVDLGAEPQALQDEFRPHVEVSDASIVRPTVVENTIFPKVGSNSSRSIITNRPALYMQLCIY